jgi:hypothetical protein
MTMEQALFDELVQSLKEARAIALLRPQGNRTNAVIMARAFVVPFLP